MSVFELTVYRVGKKRPLTDLPDSIWLEIECDHPTVRHVATGRYRCADHGELALILNRYWDSSTRYMRIDKVTDNRIYTPRVSGTNYTGHFFELRIYNRKRGYELTDLKPKDIEEIKRRWPEFQHYGVGLYRSDSSNVGIIANYFKGRNYYMEVKEYGRKKRRESEVWSVTPIGKRTVLTYFRDAFPRISIYLTIVFIPVATIMYTATMGMPENNVVSGVFFAVAPFVITLQVISFIAAPIIVIFVISRFAIATLIYILEPIILLFKKNREKG
jgi:hypothetical protein